MDSNGLSLHLTMFLIKMIGKVIESNGRAGGTSYGINPQCTITFEAISMILTSKRARKCYN